MGRLRGWMGHPDFQSLLTLLADGIRALKVFDFGELHGRPLEPKWLERHLRPAEGSANALPTLAGDSDRSFRGLEESCLRAAARVKWICAATTL